MGNHDPAEESTMLQAAFKKLKIDPEWNSNQLINYPDNDSLHGLWAGKRLTGKAKSLHHKSCSNNFASGKGCTFAGHRVEPYALDCIDTMQHLSFKSERCTKSSCGCKKLKGSKLGTLSAGFNFTQGSSPVKRRLIWDEKLRLRNSEKDRKQIIRSAKLCLYREGKGFQAQPFFSFGRILKKQHVSSSCSGFPVFGSRADNSPGFDSVKSTPPPPSRFPIEDMNNSSVADSKVLLSKIRPSKRDGSVADGGNSLTDSSHQGIKRKSPSRLKSVQLEQKMNRKHDKTCSLEARISKEDFSVNELASYFENYVYIPKKMSSMAEMMYT